MVQRSIGGELAVGQRDERGAGVDRRWMAANRREQATARAAVLIGEWLDGQGDRRTIERAYLEIKDALT